MRFSGTVVTVDPHTHMVIRLIIAYGIQYSINAIENLIGEYIFTDFNILSLLIKFSCADGRIDLTGNFLFVYIF